MGDELLDGAEVESRGDAVPCTGNRTEAPVTVAFGEGRGDGKPPTYERFMAVNGGSFDNDCLFGDIEDRADILTE